MIEVSRRRLLVDGVPRIVLSGEVHYFRLARADWGSRLEAAADAGCTAIASYLPWIFHELPGGELDVTGRTRPERDVGAFIDLCAAYGLAFIARPGPFVMAELMNEGLPDRVYAEHPEIVPVGWDGVPAPSRTVDYLAPAFLAEVRRWYGAIMPLLARRLGNLLAVQLDNEVGMLAWVTNSPDLTDHLLADFTGWLRKRYGDEEFVARYPILDVRAPSEAIAPALRVDLVSFMRDRFARYLATLRTYAEQLGVYGIPFLVNVHGTADGSAASFPIGISQLMDAYAGIPGMLSSSDHYVGELDLTAATDLYVLNEFSAAVHDSDQPLTSVEFEAGSGDYGGGQEREYDPSTVDLKTRLFVAQGNRLVNYYLFAGGTNFPVEAPDPVGTQRIGITGERHGVAAPVDPDGRRSRTYAPTARAIAVVRAHERWLAGMAPEYDGVALAFVADAYATEYAYPASESMRVVADDLVRHRGAGPRRALARSMLLAGYRFTAADLRRDPADPVLAVSTGIHLGAAEQARLANHVRSGGGLLLLGRLPRHDFEGRPCTTLANALGVVPNAYRTTGNRYYPSVRATGWAPLPGETRVGWLETVSSPDRVAVPLLTDVTDESPCGLALTAGAGRAVLLSAELPADEMLFGTALAWLGAVPGLVLGADGPGVFGITTADATGQQLVHLLNVSAYPVTVRPTLTGEPLLCGEPLTLDPRTGLILPLDLELGGATLLWSTAEIAGSGPGRLTVSLRQPYEHLVLDTELEVTADAPATVHRDGRRVRVVANRAGTRPLTLTWRAPR